MAHDAFAIDPEGVDPSRVPSKTLPTGKKIPVIGLGTFGSDHASPQECAEAVRAGISLGYRHIDCASVYGNEREIGGVLADVISSGKVPREDLWVTSKVWNDMHGPGDVLLSCAKSLRDLRLDYLDLFLVHWPFPNYHTPGCSVDYRSPDARSYIHEDYMKTWRQMERLVDMGLVRHIGTSNMTIPKLKLVLRDCRIKPACNEMELHPAFQQSELLSFVVSNGILPIAYSPIGSPDRPERDRTESDVVDIKDPAVVRIAEAHGIHPATACVKWSAQKGQIPIPFSTKRRNLLSNLKAVCEDPLTADEMREIAKADRNCRLIKGQVFLWKDGQTWEDLWDVDGTITPR
jgi:alcohol dehydrogenase (NADP+)